MIGLKRYIVSCNGIKLSDAPTKKTYIRLNHNKEEKAQNIRIELGNFVNSIYKLDGRKKDLLEIAGYVFTADRKAPRGSKNNVEYHSWSRTFEIHIPVRDFKFWNQPEVKELLNDSLSFMTGDYRYDFHFYSLGGDIPTNIFDNHNFVVEKTEKMEVVLFSGGLDSLAGVVELLETTDKQLCLVSHNSGNQRVAKTQTVLVKKLNELYSDRCSHYVFKCNLKKQDSVDETQRTRSFLFNTIAFAISTTYGKDDNTLFENGITSFNFAETQDMMNSRASRTTHPKALFLLSKLFSKVNKKNYVVKNKYYSKTKTDVISVLVKYGKIDLLETSITCSSQSRLRGAGFSHCGKCSQCIDRRFAAYATKVEKYDNNGLYESDFLTDDLIDEHSIKPLVDYVGIAQKYSNLDYNSFCETYMPELSEIEIYIEGKTEEERTKVIYDVCRRHSEHITTAIEHMRKLHDKPLEPFRENSFFNIIIGPRVYQKKEIAKKEIPYRKLKELSAGVYEKLLLEKKIDISEKETKINKTISKKVIHEIEKEFNLTWKNKNTIHDYFRQLKIQVKKENTSFKIKLNVN